MTQVDREWELEKARRRVHCLEEDGEMFGLVPAEVEELARLKAMLAEEEDRP